MARGGQGSQLATPHIVIDKLARNGRGGPLTTMCSQLCQKVCMEDHLLIYGPYKWGEDGPPH